jgi:hypothetical protein
MYSGRDLNYNVIDSTARGTSRDSAMPVELFSYRTMVRDEANLLIRIA